MLENSTANSWLMCTDGSWVMCTDGSWVMKYCWPFLVDFADVFLQ